MKTTATRATRIRGGSLQRREQQKRELKQYILDAASTEFLEHGYESFSLRRVAERIGYTPTTIYLYFQNKDDLLLATVQDGFASFDQAIARAADATLPPLERIAKLGRTYVAFGLENPALYRLMFMQRSDFYLMPHLIGFQTPRDESPVAVQSAEQQVVAQNLLVSAVEAAILAGQIPSQDAQMAADALWAGVHGVVALATSPLMARDHATRVTDNLIRILIEGLKTTA